jgi:ribosomal protein S18 acetylase RimI-like enzyme
MPIILEQISHPDAEDRNDLIKIYQDYPKTLGDSRQNSLGEWIDQRLADGQTLFAGRFNGRLLAAIWGSSDQQQLQLEYLCVRKLTRRRGVARQLLTLLIKRAKQQQLKLTVRQPLVSIELSSLLKELDFQCTSKDEQSRFWIFAAQP